MQIVFGVALKSFQVLWHGNWPIASFAWSGYCLVLYTLYKKG